MPFEIALDDQQHRGLTNYHDGLAAEDIVALDYERRGMPVVHRRWRGPGAEIDLICQGDDGLIFVEVKKSRTHDEAAAHLSFNQLSRIAQAAEAYIGTRADDPFTPMRLDLATVDSCGRVETRENLTLY